VVQPFTEESVIVGDQNLHGILRVIAAPARLRRLWPKCISMSLCIAPHGDGGR
jgi:hypothetical protein